MRKQNGIRDFFLFFIPTVVLCYQYFYIRSSQTINIFQQKKTIERTIHQHPSHLHSNTDLPQKIPDTGVGYFKFGNDPKYCGLRYKTLKWVTCYGPGNIKNLRLNFLKFGLTEVSPLPAFDSKPFQLKWELADQADSNSFFEYKMLNSTQKINHFPGVRELGNKAYLQKNMEKAMQKFGIEVFNMFPLSFKVPTQINRFNTVHKKILSNKIWQRKINTKPNQTVSWILKLSSKDRGEGLKLINTPSELNGKEHGIVQQYIKNPYLLHGKKFTMRIYAVYTSLNPARLYIYPEGFCHIATERYSSDVKHIKNRYMHLTNPDISKARQFYRKNPRPYYWKISELRNYMHKKNDDDIKLWERIKDVMAKTLLSGIDKLKRYSKKIKISNANDIMKNNNCFELIGIDVLVDTDLKPWLLEVNPDPDLTAKDNFPIAKEIKADLLVCTPTLIDTFFLSINCVLPIIIKSFFFSRLGERRLIFRMCVTIYPIKHVYMH
eukprot:g8170.t1